MTATEAPTLLIARRTELVDRHCPACGSSKSTPVVASRPPAEDAPFETVRDCWLGFFKDKVFFSYGRCADCGLLYTRSYLAPGTIAELLGDMPENMSGVPASLLEKTQRGYFDFFQKFNPSTGDYLEIGPDTGLLTRFVARECQFDNHHLFEPNRAVLSELTASMQGKPHQIYNGFLDFDSAPAGKVSAATMVHVLDHLLDPVDTLRNLRRTMIKGGIVMVVTHDESSLLARLVGANWPAYCLQHPQVYRPATIRKVFEAAGFRVLATERSVNHFPVGYLAQHLAYALKLGKIPAFLPKSWSVPLKLGNFMTAAVVDDRA